MARRKKTVGREVVAEIRKAMLTFRLSLTDMLARCEVPAATFYGWDDGSIPDMLVSDYRRVMAAIDALRHDAKYAIEAEEERLHNAPFPLRKRTVE